MTSILEDFERDDADLGLEQWKRDPVTRQLYNTLEARLPDIRRRLRDACRRSTDPDIQEALRELMSTERAMDLLEHGK